MRYLNWRLVASYFAVFCVLGVSAAFFAGLFDDKSVEREVVIEGVAEPTGAERIDLVFMVPEDSEKAGLFTRPVSERIVFETKNSHQNGATLEDLLIDDDYTNGLTGGVFPLPGLEEHYLSRGDVLLSLMPGNTEYMWLNGIPASTFGDDTFPHALMRQLQYDYEEKDASLHSFGMITVTASQGGAYVLQDAGDGYYRITYYLRKGELVVQGSAMFEGATVPRWITQVTISE